MNQLFLLVKEKYSHHKNFDYFYADYKKAYEYCLNNQNMKFIPVTSKNNNKLISHIALIIDPRLSEETSAFFGFFETSNDLSTLKNIWHKLLEKAKEYNVTILKGPVNGSIWHQYRVIKSSDKTPFFKTEPITESYYYSLLSKLNPSLEIAYYSASRKKFDNVMPVIESGFDKLKTSGFSITELKNVDLETFRSIGRISKIVFSQTSWGYTELTETEFLNLYSPQKLNKHLNNLYILKKDDQIIGYCGTTTENKKILILKTICILPEFQGLGLGNALAYKIHQDAIDKGFKEVIYALIKEDNQIKNFPKEDVNYFRRYAAFEFKV